METKMIRQVLYILCLTGLLPILANAQFTSGSTGADGALDLSAINCPNNVCVVQLPETGILNYTTVNIPAGKFLQFKANSRNTPVILLAQSNVTLGGEINVSAPCSFGAGTGIPCTTEAQPGPGGFYGGAPGKPGFGSGAGQTNGESGRWVGALSLVPIVGGSGGAGFSYFQNYSGGGGGGAIVIASSTSINITGQGRIITRGGNGGGYGRGAGGALRLVANQVTMSGSLDACTAVGLCGVVRVEAPDGQLIFNGYSTPAAVLSPVNPTVVSNAQPQLTIQSVGGYTVPSYAGSRFDTVDLLLPNQVPDPLNVVVSANNIPTGTQVQVGFVSGSPSGTSVPCNLTGTFANSQCTATISSLNRIGVTYLLATAVFTPPSSTAQFNPKGENYVDKIKLEAVLGAKPKYIFLSTQGKVIDNSKISKNFLQYFGL